MPSSSQKQHNLMEMVAHNPMAAKRMGIPQSVGQDFVKADMGKFTKRAKKNRRNLLSEAMR